MIIKCRDIDKDIAATSQRLLQGGIRIRDWFSDKLHTHTKVMQDTCTEKKHQDTKILNHKFPTLVMEYLLLIHLSVFLALTRPLQLQYEYVYNQICLQMALPLYFLCFELRIITHSSLGLFLIACKR